MYKLYLALRYLRKRRITYFAVLSVALCTAMVLGVHSVMSGFLQTVKESSRNLLGDVILEVGNMTTFPLYDEFITELRKASGTDIVAATPVIINAGWVTLLVGRGDHPTYPVQLTGVRLDEFVQVNRFGEGLYYNRHFPGSTTLQAQRKPALSKGSDGRLRLPDDLEAALARYEETRVEHERVERQPGESWAGPGFFKVYDAPGGADDGYSGDAYPGLILGVNLVARRGEDGDFDRTVPKGTLARMTVLPQNGSASADSAYGVTAPLRYADDSRSRIHDIDSRFAYIGFDELQAILEMDGRSGREFDLPRATQIQIKLAEGVDLDAARERIEALWYDFLDRNTARCTIDDLIEMERMRVQTWLQRNAGFIAAVEKQRVLVLILLGVISVVAVVLVGCTFYMIAQERTREIGIIKSMGAGTWGIGSLFLIYAAGVGIVGSILGIITGALFVHYINDIQDWLAALHPRLRMWQPEVYSFERIPNIVNASDAGVIVLVGIVAAILGSTVAAWKAAHVWPTRALHFK